MNGDEKQCEVDSGSHKQADDNPGYSRNRKLRTMLQFQFARGSGLPFLSEGAVVDPVNHFLQGQIGHGALSVFELNAVSPID